jgi:hypothetical protein
LEVWRKLSNGRSLDAALAPFLLEERNPLVHGVDIPIGSGEVRDMVLEPFGHKRFDERFFFGMLLRLRVRDVVSRKGV